jgi:hypothetical protein
VDGATGVARSGRSVASATVLKRFLALLAGGLGIRVLLRRRRRVAPLPAPADELRAKLAESRVGEPETRVPEPEAASEQAPDVDARRADVHERARQALEELGGSGED